ncbi:MAG TPA: DUF3224 domain-containing protein [Roseiflexaceae bacterium]|nr:DUF3224 domain-containing protein [Roseiflexaceae bacterium]
MRSTANATFQIKRWDEAPYYEAAGEAKLTKANVALTYEGQIEGAGLADYLMAYPEQSDASYVGIERVSGKLGGRSGSFVLQYAGTADQNGTIRATFFVVPGSGTGELNGLRGEGNLLLEGQAERYPITLAYDLEEK